MLQPSPAYHRMREAYARWFWLTPAAVILGGTGLWQMRTRAAQPKSGVSASPQSGKRAPGRLLLVAAMAVAAVAMKNWFQYQENRRTYNAE